MLLEQYGLQTGALGCFVLKGIMGSNICHGVNDMENTAKTPAWLTKAEGNIHRLTDREKACQ